MSQIPVNAPQPSGNPANAPFSQTLDQIMLAYPGSGYAYFSGDGVVNFQGLGQYGNRTESTVAWVHVDAEPFTVEYVPGVPEPHIAPLMGLLLGMLVILTTVRVGRKR